MPSICLFEWSSATWAAAIKLCGSLSEFVRIKQTCSTLSNILVGMEVDSTSWPILLISLKASEIVCWRRIFFFRSLLLKNIYCPLKLFLCSLWGNWLRCKKTWISRWLHHSSQYMSTLEIFRRWKWIMQLRYSATLFQTSIAHPCRTGNKGPCKDCSKCIKICSAWKPQHTLQNKNKVNVTSTFFLF